MTTLASELETALFAAVLSLIAVTIGWKKGFFRMPESSIKPKHPPTLLLVFLAFGIYFLLGMLIPLLFHNTLESATTLEERVAKASWAAFGVSLSIAFALGFFLRALPQPIRQDILLKSGRFEPKKDLLLAIGAWPISFPLVLMIGGLCDILLYFLYGTFDLPDQLAVLFLKMTFGKIGYFFLATSSIVLLAPLIEETLFRGFLQSWLRRYLTPAPSIAIASLFFTAFHFSLDQGASNLSILSSLFILGCFLGFLYERRQSLFSPLLLHALFNAISVANLYFLDGT